LKISVVIPCFQAESTIYELCTRLGIVLNEINPEYEIILVEDGSKDSTWDEISQISRMNPSVLGIKLSRNFGQHNAITAGLAKSTGDWVVVMDCDLQDRPEEIINLYKRAAFPSKRVLIPHFKRRNTSKTLESCMKTIGGCRKLKNLQIFCSRNL
jgi:dolichol-phosphate mannosyltransferase